MPFIKNSTAKSILALSFAFILSVAVTTVIPTDTAKAQWVDGGDVCTSCGGDSWGDWSTTDDSWSDWSSTGDSWSDWSTTDDSWSDWSSTSNDWGDWSSTTSGEWYDIADATPTGEWYDIADATPTGEWYDIAEATPTGEWYDIAVATPTYTHKTPTYTYGGNTTYRYNTKFNLELHKDHNHSHKTTPTTPTHNHNTHNHGYTNPVNVNQVTNVNNVNNSIPVAQPQPVVRYAYPTVYPSVTVAQTNYTPAYDYVNINQVPYTGTKEVAYVLTLIGAALASIAAAVYFRGRMNVAFAGTPIVLQEETVEEVKEDSEPTIKIENGEDGPKLSFK